MPPNVLHSAFSVDYSERQNSLITAGCGVQNSYGGGFQNVNALWDTGATNSVVTPRLALLLNLVPIDKIPVKGVHGEAVANAYMVGLALPNSVVIQNLKVTEAGLTENIDILIGMDIIGMGDFSICGGQFFSYCIPTFENPIDFVEKANKVNKRIVKKNRNLERRR